MRNLFSELVVLLMSPIGFTFVCVVSSAILYRKFKGIGLSILITGLSTFFALSLPVVSDRLYQTLESQYSPTSLAQIPKSNYIVLLGGGIRPPVEPRREVELGVSGDRVLYTLRLYKAGVSSKIIVTGGWRFERSDLKSEAEYTKAMLVELGVPSKHILVEKVSRNTRENAEQTYELIRSLRKSSEARSEHHDTESILLVTSASHMPRAMSVFASVDLSVHPAATDIRVTRRQSYIWLDYLPDAVALARSSTVFKEYLGLLAWHVMRKIGDYR